MRRLVINSFNIDSTPIGNAVTSREYSVIGDPGAVFSLIMINNAGQFYNFPEKTIVTKDSDTVRPAPSFSTTATKLFNQKIDDTGVYNGILEFPTSSSDDKYRIILQAENGFKSFLNNTMSKNDVFVAAEISQFVDTTVTFAVASGASSGTYTANPPASNYTATGFSTSKSNSTFNKKITASWAVALGSSQFVIARQPVLNDFFFTTTKTTNNDSSGTSIQLTDISGLSVGMAVSGSGIASNSIIKRIIPGFKNENKSTANNHVYVIPKAIDSLGQVVENSKAGTIMISNSSTWGLGTTLTFKGFGSHADAFNSTKFTVSNLAVTLADVVTTTDAAVSNSTTIPITSTDGIKAADTVIMSGIGVTGTPHVDAVSSGVNITASSAQTIENGQTVTFKGSSRNATITADIVVQKFGKDNLTITLELDNILTVG